MLKVTMFPGMVGIDVAREMSHAVGQLHGCRRLIIDLRGNTGDGIGCLRLMSYLTPGKLPVGYSLTKAMAARGYDKQKLPRFDRIPDRKLTLIRLALRYRKKGSIVVVTEGLGPQEFHGRIVLLVNQHSASAAEMVAGFARENRLATIVGTPIERHVFQGGTRLCPGPPWRSVFDLARDDVGRQRCRPGRRSRLIERSAEAGS